MRPAAARIVVVMVVVPVALVVVTVVVTVVVVVAAVRHAKLGRADAGPVHALVRDRHPVEAERCDHALQLVERRARVEQRSQQHVAGNAREAVEIQDLRHGEAPTIVRFP